MSEGTLMEIKPTEETNKEDPYLALWSTVQWLALCALLSYLGTLVLIGYLGSLYLNLPHKP
jgi:hypothetical protein